MRRVNTLGIDLANKHVLMAALTYNLKKYLKFVNKKAISKVISIKIEVKHVYYNFFYVFVLFLTQLMPIFGLIKIKQN